MATEPAPTEAVRSVLGEVRARRPELAVLETDAFAPSGGAEGRFEPPDPSTLERAGLSSEAWLLCSADEALGGFWPRIREAVRQGGPGPKVIARYDARGPNAGLADLAAFCALPGVVVGAPADAASARAALLAAERTDAPVYLRLPTAPPGGLSDGSFGFGRAPELRAGTDLAIAAVGPTIALARTVAGRLHEIGIEARLLDGASVKPADAGSLLRAGRETGALLTVEEHPVLGGYGTMAAGLLAAAHPVPVRRVGFPDLPRGPPPAGEGGDYGLDADRLAEEAWALLRARGKVQ